MNKDIKKSALKLLMIVIGLAFLFGFLPTMLGVNSGIEKTALTYLKNKYGDEFRAGGSDMTPGSSTFRYIAHSSKYPNDWIYVEIENYRNFNKTFRDNYLTVKFKEDTRSLILKYSESVFKNPLVWVPNTNNINPEFLKASATFDEYLKAEETTLDLAIIIPESSYKDKSQIESLMNTIKRNGTGFFANFYVLKDSDFASLNNKYDDDTYNQLNDLGDAVIEMVAVSYTDSELEYSWK